jgi:Undecaprenyl-phosphate glucose phosphotransferase
MSDVAKRSEFAAEAVKAQHGLLRQDLGAARISRWTFVAIVQALDILVVLLAAVGSLRHALHGLRVPPAAWAACLLSAVLVAAVLHCVLRSGGAYRFQTLLNPLRATPVIGIAWCVLMGPFLAVDLLQEPGRAYLQGWSLDWFVSGLLLLSASRPLIGLVGARLRARGLLGYSFCIVGSGEAAIACATQAAQDPKGATVLGYIDDPGGDCPGVPGVPHLGAIKDLPRILQRRHLDAVVIALPLHEQRRITAIVTLLRRYPIRVLLAPWFDGVGNAPFAMPSLDTDIGGMPLYAVSDRPIAGWSWIFKDVQDRSLAALALLFVSPVMLGIAVAIKLSSRGPVLFRQNRRGYGGREFRIYKFRSMHQSASIVSHTRLALTRRDDPRIFPLGRLLRRCSLDELPQLLNVLFGDMWIVGPRPHSPLAEAAGVLYVEAVDDYIARYRIKPGITGWAQVNGWRGPTETLEQIDGRVRCDLYYIENWSPLLDLRIIVATIAGGLKHENAF